MTFSEKDPAEIVPLTFDFRSDTAAPSSPVVSIVQDDGPSDPDIVNMLVGAPQVIGTQVLQKVGSGLNGATYSVRCQIETAEGYRFVLVGDLPVITA